jgi:hypothetical protein
MNLEAYQKEIYIQNKNKSRSQITLLCRIALLKKQSISPSPFKKGVD